ncbi:MAG: cell wall hydrolase [Desulfomicrobium sp.]|nr:cell wall hydrolase [Pseudomonadota bacterium]MBV1713225.1 cell wall hydrolase [Desulfomicrobium sp.]MBU4571329.1 cell wall hydrolase [Pseudomonadota bacterium]MBU4595591.1 cell wall hydrolase [Pseudomonadota bacterium]MBV1720033.1 cell wall hydrolase [Desulfomicrobium sp.]
MIRTTGFAICIATILFVGSGLAWSQSQRAESAEVKAEALEQSSSSEGDQTHPSPSGVITKPEAQAVDPAGEMPLDDALTCLARTIYWEARGEETAGIEAIAHVVMNRLGHEGFPDTICEVVMQGSEQGACQFSWWCDGLSDDAQEEEAYFLAKEIARKTLNKQLQDRTGGALYFHRKDVTPQWSAEYLRTVVIGRHIFYKPDDGAAK